MRGRESTQVPTRREARPTATLALEQALRAEGFFAIAGVDEAGRGPLAGPVVAAAVVLDPAAEVEGLADSKTLTAARRGTLYELILARAAAVGIASVPAAVIDRINIRQATLLAMRRAVAALSLPPDLALVDGNDPPALLCPVRTVVRGDSQVACIAAASIVAKVARDRIMDQVDSAHPGYDFAIHMGYGTARHRAALAKLGPCTHHRRSFGPLKVDET
ncbi:MAG TPA: ribonuclease HII [Beijerinckiaceae bacterium]|jgi:ribonuclease HII